MADQLAMRAALQLERDQARPIWPRATRKELRGAARTFIGRPGAEGDQDPRLGAVMEGLFELALFLLTDQLEQRQSPTPADERDRAKEIRAHLEKARLLYEKLSSPTQLLMTVTRKHWADEVLQNDTPLKDPWLYAMYFAIGEMNRLVQALEVGFVSAGNSGTMSDAWDGNPSYRLTARLVEFINRVMPDEVVTGSISGVFARGFRAVLDIAWGPTNPQIPQVSNDWIKKLAQHANSKPQYEKTVKEIREWRQAEREFTDAQNAAPRSEYGAILDFIRDQIGQKERTIARYGDPLDPLTARMRRVRSGIEQGQENRTSLPPKRAGDT